MKLRIGMVTGGLKFAGDSLEKHSLGGSETAFLCMARELAARGHQVTAFCNTDRPGRYDNVDYLPLHAFEQCLPNTTFDVLIASRWPEHLAAPSRANLRILWLHDTLTDKQRLMGASWQTDEVWLLSDYHTQDYCGNHGDEPGEENPKCPELRPHVWKTNNGVDLELIKANLRPKVPGKCIYTSRPERGLHYLLQMVPEIAKNVPGFKLHYANYSLAGMQLPEHVLQINAYCDNLAKQLGDLVVPMGHLTKAELYQEMSSAQLFISPTPFPEISCISMMEAQACGTPVISTNDFAIKETVINHKTGILIDGQPTEKAYIDQFIAKTTRLLQKPEVLAGYAERGIASITERGYTWKQVAESWERHIFELFEKRSSANPQKILDRLTWNGDLKASGADMAKVYDVVFQPEEVPALLQKEIPIYSRMLSLLAGESIKPKSILEFSSFPAPFSYVLKQHIEDTEVAVCPLPQHKQLVEEVAARLTKVSGIEVLEGPPEDARKFDLVVLNRTLDYYASPVMEARAAAQYLNEGGFLAFTVGMGPNSHTLKTCKHNRVWSLDFDDLRRIFPDSCGVLQGTFVPEYGNQGGTWVAVVKVTDPSKIGADWNYEEIAKRRALLTRPYQSIGVSMIVKNEEENILKCLKAIRPYVDEIVVADTGSRDNTISLALPHVDRVKQIAFDSFSQARNESREGLTTDWYFWLDADEQFLGGDQLRKYLDSTIYAGLVVKQQHLMIDLHGTYDTPIRILKNRPEYRFTGLVHEHCEDTSRGPYGHGIRPSIVANDLDLAHYGYPSEAIRRKKCSNRNMDLLIRDLKENPDRPINKLLFMRDCLNIVKWHITSGQPVQKFGLHHALLNTAIALFYKHFDDPKHKLYVMTDPMCQEAMKILAACGLPFEDRKTPPFEVALTLGAAMGKPVEADKLKATTRFFVDTDQFHRYMEHKLADLEVGLGADAKGREELLTSRGQTRFMTDTVAAIELLRYGTNVFS